MLTSTQLPEPPTIEYGEIPQQNPIQYALYQLEADDKWVPDSAWFKCRDFFNEFVGVYNNHRVKIYNFDFRGKKLPDYGVWLRLRNLYSNFFHNIELLRPVLSELDVELNVVPLADKPSEAFTLLPRKLFENTFLISKVTLLIRMCNANVNYESYDDLLAKSQEPLYIMNRDAFNKRGLTLPKEYSDFWYYSSKQYNSKSKNHIDVIVHDCGFKNWEFAMGAK
jgi:hypothetical protein